MEEKESAVADQLAGVIVAAARGVRDSRANQTVPLVFSGLKVTLEFVVKVEAGAEAKFDILPIGFDLSAKVDRKSTHQIVVAYENPDPPEK
jgi:hypothetical protein